MSKPLPYTFEDISAEEESARAKLYTKPTTTMVKMTRLQPQNLMIPVSFKKLAQDITDFEVRSDDVFMMTYPKAGSTWVQEMVWQIVNDFDVEKGKEVVFTRAPFFEMSCLCGDVPAVPSLEQEKSDNPMEKMMAFLADSVGYTSRLSSPRVIKSHLSIDCLPEGTLDKCKVIWVARNPKDSLVSFYHHERLLPVHGIREDSFDEFFSNYLQGKVLYGHYWEYMKRNWQQRDHPNLKLVYFEDLKKDLRSVVVDIAKFLGKDFSDEKVDKLVEHLSFENFKNNDAVNMKPPKGSVPDEVRNNFNFIRQGKVGGWKDQMSEDQIKEIDAWIEKYNSELNIPLRFE